MNALSTGNVVSFQVFTLTTRFTYNGPLGARVAVEVVGQGATTYTLDYAAGNRILAEMTDADSTLYLYGRDCLGELRDGEPGLSGVEGWLYYLNDAEGLVRQGADEQGQVVSGWLFDPDGTVLEGPEGPVSHLVCGGVYDWSTGLIYEDGRYFDPMLGIWLALVPLMVVQSWRGRKKRRRGFPWVWLLLLGVCVGVTLTACGPDSGNGTPTPDLIPCVEAPSTGTPGPTPTGTFGPGTGTPGTGTPGGPTPGGPGGPTPSPFPSPSPSPSPSPTPPPVTEEDVTETARSAVGEVGKTIPEDQQFKVEKVLVVSWTWGDEPNRDRALLAVSWIVQNRVDSPLNFMCTTYAECARSPDFQGRDPGYNPTEHEKGIARQALEQQGVDPTNGAVYFFDFTLSAPGSYLAKITNLEDMNLGVKEAIQPGEAGFYFLSAEQWNEYHGISTPTP